MDTDGKSQKGIVRKVQAKAKAGTKLAAQTATGGAKLFRDRVDEWWFDHRFKFYLGGLLMLITAAFFWHRIFITIPSGHQGAMYLRFGGGTVVEQVWGEGFHVIAPWDKLTIYETRISQRMIEFPVLTQEGLEISMHVSVRFQPIISAIGRLHQEVGPDYFDRLVVPEVQAHLRRTIGDRTAFDTYSTEGDLLKEASRIPQDYSHSRRYIRLDEILIKRIILPKVVKDAIEQKLRQEELLREYEFRLQREEQEAERKRTEASGIRDYNTIARNISPDLLRWRGIEATVELARSNNSKVIIIGGGRDGLPIILDTNSAAASGGADDATTASPSRLETPRAAPPPDVPPSRPGQ